MILLLIHLHLRTSIRTRAGEQGWSRVEAGLKQGYSCLWRGWSWLESVGAGWSWLDQGWSWLELVGAGTACNGSPLSPVYPFN